MSSAVVTPSMPVDRLSDFAFTELVVDDLGMRVARVRDPEDPRCEPVEVRR